MPYYNYKCTKCEREDEHIKSVSDRDNCPKCLLCHSETKRQMEASGVVSKKGGKIIIRSGSR